MEYWIGAAVGAIVAVSAALLVFRSRLKARQALAASEAALSRQAADLDKQRTMAELERGLRDRHTRELAEANESAAKAQAEASGALAASERFAEENKELREQAKRDQDVLKALQPVQVKIGDVQEHVARLERERAEQYGKLDEQLRQAAATDERLRQQTQALVGAMRATSARAMWGEVELRRILEASGMLNRIDFLVQETKASATDSAKRIRPDVIVHLPGEKYLAVDAKVPLTAFLEATDISPDGTPQERDRREALLAQHAKALKGHVDTLAAREYWAGLDVSPEFTILFLPAENLLGEAVRADAALMEHALGRGVALATPSTLLALLKTVATIWQQTVLTDQAKELLALGKAIYQRLGALGGHVAKMGRSLGTAVSDYNKMVGSLERQVLSAARRFPGFDPDALAAIEEIGEKGQVQQLTRPELLAVEAAPQLEAGGEHSGEDSEVGTS